MTISYRISKEQYEELDPTIKQVYAPVDPSNYKGQFGGMFELKIDGLPSSPGRSQPKVPSKMPELVKSKSPSSELSTFDEPAESVSEQSVKDTGTDLAVYEMLSKIEELASKVDSLNAERPQSTDVKNDIIASKEKFARLRAEYHNNIQAKDNQLKDAFNTIQEGKLNVAKQQVNMLIRDAAAKQKVYPNAVTVLQNMLQNDNIKYVFDEEKDVYEPILVNENGDEWYQVGSAEKHTIESAIEAKKADYDFLYQKQPGYENIKNVHGGIKSVKAVTSADLISGKAGPLELFHHAQMLKQRAG